MALVTGAGRGMGRGVAETLARLGATVAVNDFYPERARGGCRRDSRAGPEVALAAPADVTDYAAVQAMAARVKDEAGAIDIYVSNAGAPTSGMAMPASGIHPRRLGALRQAQHVRPDERLPRGAAGHARKGLGPHVAITSESWRAGGADGNCRLRRVQGRGGGLLRQLAAETGRKGIANALSLGTMNIHEWAMMLIRSGVTACYPLTGRLHSGARMRRK